jgi:hypothetical protein
VLPINYLLRRWLTSGVSNPIVPHQQTDIKLKLLFIPSFIKSMLYFGLMMLSLYLGWFVLVLPVVISIFGVEALWCYIEGRSGSQRGSGCKCESIEEKVVEILLAISFLLHVEVFDINYNIHLILLICFSGLLCLLAFFYLHHRIFELYHTGVDEILAKEYPIELFNFLLCCLIFVSSSYIEIEQIEDIISFSFPPFNSTAETNNTAPEEL